MLGLDKERGVQAADKCCCVSAAVLFSFSFYFCAVHYLFIVVRVLADNGGGKSKWSEGKSLRKSYFHSAQKNLPGLFSCYVEILPRLRVEDGRGSGDIRGEEKKSENMRGLLLKLASVLPLEPVVAMLFLGA